MLTGVVLGSSLAVAGAGIGAYQMFPNEPEFAEVLAVNAVTERVETPREVCKDVTERTIGYDVDYRIGEEPGRVRMDHQPGATIPLRDGQLVLAATPS
jgi:uncharacterized protein YcfJ